MTRIYLWIVSRSSTGEVIGSVYAEDEDHAVAVAYQTFGMFGDLEVKKET